MTSSSPGRPGPGPDPGPPGPQEREGPGDLPELAAPAGGGDHLDPQAPARPGTPRRKGTRRAMDAHHPAPPGAERRHLAQLEHRRTGQAIPDRVRPLTCPDFPVNDLVQSAAPRSGSASRSAHTQVPDRMADDRRLHHRGGRPQLRRVHLCHACPYAGRVLTHLARKVRQYLRSWPTGCKRATAASPLASLATPPAAHRAADRSAQRRN